VISLGLTSRLELWQPRLIFGDPLLCELSILDVRKQGLHRLAGFVGDDLLARHVVAVLGRIADLISHVVQPAAIHQIDDQLEFMETLEVRNFRLIARFDEGFETGLHQS